MPTDTQSWIVAGLLVLSALATLAVKTLGLSPDWNTLLTFVSAAIDIILSIVFGRTALRLRAARLTSKAK